MPIRIPCAGCSAPLDIVEKLQGKQVRCPECHHVFIFTAPLEPMPATACQKPGFSEETGFLTPQPEGKPPAEASFTSSAPVPPERAWGTREEGRQAERSSGALVVGLLVGAVALVLVLCGGGLVGGWLLFRSEAVPYDDDWDRGQPMVQQPRADVMVDPMDEPPAPELAIIRPPQFDGPSLTVPLPGTFADVTVGGAGRYLVLHLPKERKLAILDVNEARIVKEIPLPEERVLIAAGMEQLIVLLPRQQQAERLNLATLQWEDALALPPWHTIKRIAMGSASNGPLLVEYADGTDAIDRGGFEFVDIFSMKAYPTRWDGEVPHSVFRDQYEIRASANGEVFTLWATSHNPQGLQSIVRSGQRATGHYQHDDCFHLIPGPDGQVLYTGRGRFTQRLQPIDVRANPGAGGPLLIPAARGDYYLRIEPPVQFGPPAPGSCVAIHRADNGQQLFRVPKLDVGLLAEDRPRDDPPYDRRLHFIPAAKLLIFLPSGNDRLILHRVDVDAPPQ